MTDLPAGTVTFLFTDIEGSTELLKQLREQYADLLADQRRILRASGTSAMGGRYCSRRPRPRWCVTNSPKG
jgi:class 3 adenylate cyclase